MDFFDKLAVLLTKCEPNSLDLVFVLDNVLNIPRWFIENSEIRVFRKGKVRRRNDEDSLSNFESIHRTLNIIHKTKFSERTKNWIQQCMSCCLKTGPFSESNMLQIETGLLKRIGYINAFERKSDQINFFRCFGDIDFLRQLGHGLSENSLTLIRNKQAKKMKEDDVFLLFGHQKFDDQIVSKDTTISVEASTTDYQTISDQLKTCTALQLHGHNVFKLVKSQNFGGIRLSIHNAKIVSDNDVIFVDVIKREPFSTVLNNVFQLKPFSGLSDLEMSIDETKCVPVYHENNQFGLVVIDFSEEYSVSDRLLVHFRI